MADKDLQAHHAVITGGGTGIGLAIARALAEKGARLTLIGRTPARLEAAAASLPQAQAVAADVTEAGAVRAAMTRAASAFGPVSILVNNAGAAKAVPFL